MTTNQAPDSTKPMGENEAWYRNLTRQNATDSTKPETAEREELLPCPFCGAGETCIFENGKIWTGMKYSEPTSVSVRHHCEPIKGQPSRMLDRVGKDRESAVAAWNMRAAALMAADGQECTRSHPHEEMSPMCELRTEIARLNNKLANMEADGKAGGEVVVDAFENLKSSTALADAYIDLWQKYRALQRSKQAAQVAQPMTESQLGSAMVFVESLKYVPLDRVVEVVLGVARAVEAAHGIGKDRS